MRDVIQEYLVQLGFKITGSKDFNTALEDAKNKANSLSQTGKELAKTISATTIGTKELKQAQAKATKTTKELEKAKKELEKRLKANAKAAEEMSKKHKAEAEALKLLITETLAGIASGAVIVAVAIATVDAGIVKLFTDLAKADLANEIFARKMWTTKENATALNDTLKAMGATLEDLYYSPELQKQFLQLKGEAGGMTAGKEFDEQMKFIRSIMFEWNRFKLEITYALKWIGFYLYKYLEEPMSRVKLSFQDFNDYIQKNMPQITQKIAQVLSWFGRISIMLFDIGKTVATVFNAIPNAIKFALAGVGAIIGAYIAGPVGWAILGITALLLLLEDFYTFKAGGKSLLEGLWSGLDEIFKIFGDNGEAIKGVWDSFKGLAEKVKDLGVESWNLVKAFSKFMGLDLDKLFNDIASFVGDLTVKAVKLFNITKDYIIPAGLIALKKIFEDISKIIDNVIISVKAMTEALNSTSFSDILKGLTDIMPTLPKLGVMGYDPATMTGSAYTNTTTTIAPIINVFGTADAYTTATAVRKSFDNIEYHNA